MGLWQYLSAWVRVIWFSKWCIFFFHRAWLAGSIAAATSGTVHWCWHSRKKEKKQSRRAQEEIQSSSRAQLCLSTIPCEGSVSVFWLLHQEREETSLLLTHYGIKRKAGRFMACHSHTQHNINPDVNQNITFRSFKWVSTSTQQDIGVKAEKQLSAQ